MLALSEKTCSKKLEIFYTTSGVLLRAGQVYHGNRISTFSAD
jgi:hypothetical protein